MPAIRAHVPLEVLRDTIQPFPTLSAIDVGALKALHGEVTSELTLTPPEEAAWQVSGKQQH